MTGRVRLHARPHCGAARDEYWHSPRLFWQQISWLLPKGLTIDRLQDRRNLLSTLDGFRREIDRSGAIEAMDRFDQKAYEMVTGERARKAFDIAAEKETTRTRYGRHKWGQSVLLARRVVEAGSKFVSCHNGGWDSHWNHESRMEKVLPQVNQVGNALITDLSDRSMLETTMVIVMGEFDRTPKMNDGGIGAHH